MTKAAYNIIPGWMVLVIDFFVFFHAGLLSFFLLEGLSLAKISNPAVWLACGTFAALGTLATYFLKNHSIRAKQNTIQEILSFSRTLIVTAVLVATLALVSKLSGVFPFPPLNVLVLGFGITLLGLMIVRMAVKQSANYFTANLDEERVLLIAHPTSQALSRKILQNSGFSLEAIQAYLSENFSESKRIVLGAPIYEKIADLDKVIDRHQISHIYISEEGLSLEQKRAYIDACLKKGVQPHMLHALDAVAGEVELKKAVVEDYLTSTFSMEKKTSHLPCFVNKTILISGSGGKIGAELCKQLLSHEPAHIILVEQIESELLQLIDTLKNFHHNSAITPVVIDSCNKGRLRPIFENHKPHFVFHAGLLPNSPLTESNPEVAVKANITSTKNLAELALEHESAKFILISSYQAVKPSDTIAASIRLAEMYLQNINSDYQGLNKTQFINARQGQIIGVNDYILHRIKQDLKKDSSVSIQHPDTEHSFFSLSQTCRFILEAAQLGDDAKTYVLPKTSPIKLMELVNRIYQLSEPKIASEIKVHFDKDSKGVEASPLFDSGTENAKQVGDYQILELESMEPIKLDVQEKLLELDAILDQKSPMALNKFFKTLLPEFKNEHKFVAITNRQN